ncbi:MAG: hypothetical protein HUK24_09135, partial [Sphaerochaetaceae bacterium]|nr:hypothetical protein [Sphaerochaetaceae bacterium]
AFAYALVSEREMANYREQSPITPLQIFTGNTCRRRALLKGLGQEKESCTGCDVCLGKKTVNRDTTIMENFVQRYPFKYTPSSGAQLLGGSINKTEISFFDKQNPFYGLLNHWNMDNIEIGLLNIPTISYVNFLKKGKLLYKNNKSPNRFIALILRTINDVLSKITSAINKKKNLQKEILSLQGKGIFKQPSEPFQL